MCACGVASGGGEGGGEGIRQSVTLLGVFNITYEAQLDRRRRQCERRRLVHRALRKTLLILKECVRFYNLKDPHGVFLLIVVLYSAPVLLIQCSIIPLVNRWL